MANEAKTVNTLRDILPALFVGQGGQALTPEQIKRRQDLSASSLAFATDTSPTGGGWFSVAAKGLAGLRSGMEEDAANNAVAQNATDSQNLVNAIYGGGTPAATVAPSGDGATVSSAPTVAYNPGDVQAQVVDELRNAGLPENVIQGALANMQDESGFNPGINESNPTVAGSRGGYGLYQLTGPRRVAYEKWAGDQGVSLDDPRAQARYFALELQGPESAAANKIMATTTPNEAAQAINTYFLRPSPENLSKRNARYANMTFPEMAAAQQAASPAATQAPGGYVDPAVSVQPRQAVAQALSPSVSAQPQQANPVAQALMAPQAPAPIAPSASIPGLLNNNQRQAAQAAVGNPRLDQNTRRIAQDALERDYQAQGQQQQAQAAYQQQQAEWQYKMRQGQYEQQQAQQAQQGRVDYLVRGGMNPQDALAVAGNDELFKQYAQNAFKAPEQTSDIKNWNEVNAGRRARGEPEMSLEEYQLSQRRAGATNVTVGAGENEFDKELGKGDAKIVGAASEAGIAASRNLGQLAQLESALEGAPTGAEALIKGALGNYGINTEGLDKLQSAEALINTMVPGQRQAGSGPMSDKDIEMYRSSLPRLVSTPEGNRQIIRDIRAINQYDQEGAEIADKIRSGEVSRAEGMKMLRARKNPLEGYRNQDNSSNQGKTLSTGEKKRMKFNPETGRLE